MSKETFISQMTSGAEYTDFFMVKNVSIRVGSNHKMYMDATFADCSGEVNAKKWDVSEDESLTLGTMKEGDIVKARVTVSEWNGIRQLKIGRIRKANDQDELNMVDFIKAAPENGKDMYDYIFSAAESISDGELRKVAVKFLSENKEKLLYYPAAMKNHHAEMAGLLYHMKRMLMMGEKACEVYTALDKDWVVCGVIIHDMEKLTEIMSNEIGISSGYSFEGKMLGHIVLGVRKIEDMAEECQLSAEKKVMLQHMILAHHYEPEYGSPVRPMFPEAELLHYLDILDAKMFDFEDALKEVAPGEFSERVRTLDNRALYKPSFK